MEFVMKENRFLRTLNPTALWQVVLVFLTLTVSASAQTPPTNARMQNVVKAFVQQTGQMVIGLGSWISGTNYDDVLAGGKSDHDLRLVIRRNGLMRAPAEQEWQSARRARRKLIENEFKEDAGKVLSATNLYPPINL
jgi:hypothetical protein